MTVMLMVTSTVIKLPLPDQSFDTSAECDTFMSVVSRGRTMGKLSIAIKEKLLLAREAMAAIIVRIDAKPKLPRNSEVRNKERLAT